jgi:peptide/nickel transport system ATP-binding protein
VFAALPPARQEKCLTQEPPLETAASATPAPGRRAAPAAPTDQQFACFYPDGELDADMLVVHETT